ncbi:hypothetical protein DENSPDRAFT_835393 [Dentipellis sp. KUC8613]|nr:hypothetical protein DENSPDRAFT_835393 [Dentipellis sp. KUC8613]
MTSRPSFTHKRRPLSAIFLGPVTNPPPNLPDLPEPPSPGAHSSGSGLPSPPATNSTSSGSAGDNSTSGGSIRRRSASDINPDMINAKLERSFGGASASAMSSPDDDGRFDDEDNTAKLTQGRRRQASAENAMALQRVRSLTERNRMALTKLSRLNTPPPSSISRGSRSTLPPLTGPPESEIGSTSRLSLHSHSYSEPPGRNRENTRSGSETERESQQPSSSYYSSDDQSATPPSSLSHGRSSTSMRRRGGSLPDSPKSRRTRDRSRGSSPGPSQRTPRKRVVMAASGSDQGRDRDYGRDDSHDVTTAALAAVASMRERSPTGGSRRSRQPLPKEFRDSKRRSLDGRPPEPTTPNRERHYSRDTPSPKISSANSFYHNQISPRPQRTARFSTVRELTRRHQTRWVSEDLTSVRSPSADDEDEDDLLEHKRPTSSGGDRSRPQKQRGGSMENSLGTRLVGGSLRAAGIGMRRDDGAVGPNNGDDDVFAPPDRSDAQGRTHRRPRSSGTPSNWDEGASIAGPSRNSGPSRTSDRSASNVLYDPRTPANVGLRYREERGAHTGPHTRAATSMADYRNHDDPLPPRTAPPGLRTYKSTYALDRDREGIGSSSVASGSRPAAHQLAPLQAPMLQERTYGSPRVRSKRLSGNGQPKALSAADQQAIEHIRLMDESLTMFETLLSRLPPMGDTSKTTIPELFRDAQSIVRYSEQVNGMLRAGTNRALERQIDSELSDGATPIDMVTLWNDVGNDFRDCMRVSDELVRTMTGFLLGVGKVLRDSGSTAAGLQHLRGASLDEDAARRLVGDARSAGSGGGGSDKRSSTDGRRSAETRRSWDLVRMTEREKEKEKDRERERERDTLRRAPSRLDGLLPANRSASSMLRDRDRSTIRDRLDLDPEEASPSPVVGPRNGLSGSTRRLYTPRDRDGHTPSTLPKPELATIESQEALNDYEPSPTPAPRPRYPSSVNPERYRTLPPLSIPPPLPTLPSETANLGRRASAGYRKTSTTSNVTVRGAPNFAISTPSATTALTPHTVSNSITPDKQAFPLTRSDSSSDTSRKNNVTFSRSSTVSVSALNGLAQRDGRKRTTSASSSEVAVHDEPLSATAARAARITQTPVTRTPRSGSDTERPPFSTLGRRTLGARNRVSLDDALEEEARGGERSGSSSQSQTMRLPAKRERRRTVTEIFS